MRTLGLDYLENQKNKKILIYGAGIVAYCYVNALIEMNFKERIECFVVHNTAHNVNSYFDIPVKAMAEYGSMEERYCIVVATRERYHTQIAKTLAGYGFSAPYFLRDGEYKEIKDHFLGGDEYAASQFALVQKKLCGLQDETDKYYYRGLAWDKNSYLDEFAALQSNEAEYLQSVEALCKGLDTRDVLTVYEILGRLNNIRDGKPVKFSMEEEQTIRELVYNFYPRCYKISEHMYCYNSYKLPINQFEVPVFWYEHGMPLLENPDAVRNKCAIDAGAFIGDSALVLSKYVKGDIYSFEADRENCAYISDTIRMNHLTNVIPVNMALSDRSGSIDLYSSTVHSGNVTGQSYSRFIPLDGTSTVVPCTTVDEFVSARKLSVGLIKSDVEGAEQSLLRGAVETIRSQKPTLIISIYHSLDDFFNIKKFIDSLDVGYRYKIFHPVFPYTILSETCLLCEIV